MRTLLAALARALRRARHGQALTEPTTIMPRPGDCGVPSCGGPLFGGHAPAFAELNEGRFAPKAGRREGPDRQRFTVVVVHQHVAVGAHVDARSGARSLTVGGEGEHGGVAREPGACPRSRWRPTRCWARSATRCGLGAVPPANEMSTGGVVVEDSAPFESKCRLPVLTMTSIGGACGVTVQSSPSVCLIVPAAISSRV
jgi:hypothetical protein